MLTELGYPTAAVDVAPRLALVRREGGEVFLAEDPRLGPLGLMSLAKHAVLHASGSVAQITALVTTPAARRRGVGRALVNAARDWAARQGCIRLTVTSAERRADAHAFYPACGMPYTGRRFSIGIPNPA
jgi:GNAT superfamily N-acetyltransferase